MLLLFLALAAGALVVILLPFYGTLMWAVISAMLFTPLFRWLLQRWDGRRNTAALATVLVLVLLAVLPLVLLSVSLANQAATVFAALQSGELNPAAHLHRMFDSLPRWVTQPLKSVGLGEFEALQLRLTGLLRQGGQFFAGQALRIGQDTFDLIAGLFVMLYVAFFLVRDGEHLLRALRHAVPLAVRDQIELSDRFTTVIRATVKGNLLVAALQGVLGGLAFWFLGLGGALLWAVLMGFLSLLPAVGAALVWGPVVLYYLSTGDIARGLGLAAWGVLVIGMVDNVLRPLLVGKDTRMPDWVVLITTLGGMSVFGINGFVLGPVIAAMFFAVWQLAIRPRPAISE